MQQFLQFNNNPKFAENLFKHSRYRVYTLILCAVGQTYTTDSWTILCNYEKAFF